MTSLPFRQRGISLVEACIVLAVTTILVATAAPNMQSLLAARRLDNSAQQLAADLQLVRNAAVVRNQALRITFHNRADASCYVIHSGDAADCRCDGAGPAVCSGEAREIKTVVIPSADLVSISSNATSIGFDPMHGTSTPTGTVRVIGANNREVRHVVNVMGRVRSCSPGALVPGYRAC